MTKIETVRRTAKPPRPLTATKDGEVIYINNVQHVEEYTGVTTSRVYRRLGIQGRLDCTLDGWTFKYIDIEDEAFTMNKKQEIKMKVERVGRKAIEELRRLRVPEDDIKKLLDEVHDHNTKHATTIAKGE